MKSKLGQVLQFVIFFGLGAGLMWWQYSRFTPVQREEFHTGLREADYFWFFVAVFIGMLAHLMRAIRWQMLLTPLNRKAGLGSRFYAVMIGYLANYAFPRLGEVTRAGVLKTSDDIPFAESFGTIVVERLVDLLCLAVIFFIVLIVQFAELQALWLKYLWHPASEKIAGMMENPVLFYGVICAIALFIGLLVMLRKRISGKLSGKAKAFFVGLKEGMLSIKKVPNPFLFVVQSLLIWTGYYLSLYTCFYCFDDTSSLTLHTALILLLFGTFGVAFTPGGIGAYQIIITEIMVAIAPATIAAAAPFAWLSWGAQVATVIIFTGIAFATRPALNKLRP